MIPAALSSLGLIVSAVGVYLAIVPPTVGAPWGADESNALEKRLQARYHRGIALIIVGTALQLPAAVGPLLRPPS